MLRLILLILTLFSCQKRPAAPVGQAVEVTVYVIEPQSIPMDFSFLGVVQSSHQVQIRSRVEGVLENIAYIEGASVKEGDLLFQIGSRRFEDVVKDAQANLEKEQAILTQSQQTLSRIQPLYLEKASSQKDLDDANAQVLTAQASVDSARAKLDQAELDLSYTSILSPISGVTSSANLQEGSLINPNANEPLTTVSVLDPIWINLNISESFFLTNAEKVAKGEWFVPENAKFTVTATLSNGMQFPYTGTVSFVSPIFHQATGTLVTRAVFPNPNSVLKPGQFVNVKVSGAVQLNAILVPQESVQQGDAGHFVYIVTEEKKAELRPVVVGDWYKEYWIIKSGLGKGDRVIVAGVNKVKNETAVKIKKTK